MVFPFNFRTVSQIIFGPGKICELPAVITSFGRTPLFVLGSQSFSNTERWHSLKTILQDFSIDQRTVHIASEPSPELIDTLVSVYFNSNIDIVIAIGGGSVLDAGKAISAMLVEGGGINRFLEGVGTENVSGKKHPFIAVPTTAGTGSEATNNAVISSVGESGFKKSLRHSNYFPNVALVDPELSISCPQNLTVACGMDCFTQLVEAYLSTNCSAITDNLAFDGIRGIQRSLYTVCTDGNNLRARSDLAYSTLISGIVLSNAGLGTIHGFAATIGGFFNIPHGVVCGTLMAPVNRAVLTSLRNSGENNGALKKYSRLGELFSGTLGRSASWYQDFFIEELIRLTSVLNIPQLSDYGVKKSDIERIVKNTGNKYNPARLSNRELTQILSSMLQ